MLDFNLLKNNQTVAKIDKNSLFFSPRYNQITFKFKTPKIYGLGENGKSTFQHQFQPVNQATIWPIWSKDHPTFSGFSESVKNNFYGHQTVLYFVDEHQEVNGVFVKNSNAMDVEFALSEDVEQDGEFVYLVTFRIIGGDLDFYFFTGGEEKVVESGDSEARWVISSADQAVNQYLTILGLGSENSRPTLPAYWSLGFHLTKWGYKSTQEFKQIHQNMRDLKFPLDVGTVDIDYMSEYKDFTLDSESWSDLPSYISDLRDQHHMKFVYILDPGIKIEPNYAPYESGKSFDIFIKRDRSKIAELNSTEASIYAQGRVWPGFVHYPDFTNPETETWWLDQINHFTQNVLNLDSVDGLWIDMNEPSNFGDWTEQASDYPCTDKPSNPPYVPNVSGPNGLWGRTICLNSQTYGNQTFFDTKEKYGHQMAKITRQYFNQKLVNKRGFLLTRSNTFGTGNYASHWYGDNFSTFQQLRQSILSSFEYSLFGFLQTGADICGFSGVPTEELCLRWQQVGAFYTYSRNHNAANNFQDQEPSSDRWSLESQMIMRDHMRIRYQLLPNLYTLMFRASHNFSDHEKMYQIGHIFRSLALSFPSDPISNLGKFQYQFFWGDALMFVPQVFCGETTTEAYFPDFLNFYDFRTQKLVNSGIYTIENDSEMPIFQVGGSILVNMPLLDHQTTTFEQHFGENDRQTSLQVAFGNDKLDDQWDSKNHTIFYASGFNFLDDILLDQIEPENYFFNQFFSKYDTKAGTIEFSSQNLHGKKIPNPQKVDRLDFLTPEGWNVLEVELLGVEGEVQVTDNVISVFLDSPVELHNDFGFTLMLEDYACVSSISVTFNLLLLTLFFLAINF